MDPADLADIVGEENVLTGEAARPYSVGGMAPGAVVAPGTRDEAAQLIRLARERGRPLLPYGGGTQVSLGHPPHPQSLVLSTRRLSRVVDYQPDDMTITAEPGVTLAELARALAERGQFLPLDPPHPERATVGGTVASAASGPWRAAYGTPRDWVIGCRVVGADGVEVRGGGQVVKNVAGYDLPKMYTGSHGTLGLLTEVTFKVMPRPPAEGYCIVPLSGPADAERLLAGVMDSDIQPSVAELTCSPGPATGGEGPGWGLFFQFLHVREAVDWQVRRLGELAGRLGLRLGELPDEVGRETLQAYRNLPLSVPFVARIGTVSAKVGELAAGAAQLYARHKAPPVLLAHAATGQLYVCAGPEAGEPFARELRALAASAGASCVFPRLPGPLEGKVDPWGEPGPEQRLLRGIKQALDPSGLFSPGRFVGGL